MQAAMTIGNNRQNDTAIFLYKTRLCMDQGIE